jgi:cytidyltransferase-like protein
MNNTIYVDGTFDLLHSGHINFFKQIKESNDILIVGVISDTNVLSYKRKPYIDLDNRVIMLENLKIVDKVIKNCPFKNISAKFIKDNNITKVYYAGENNTWKEHYKIPIEMEIMNYIPYSINELSTTKIINSIINTNINKLSAVECSKVYVKHLENKGYSVFSKKNFKTGELIEKGLIKKLSDNENKIFDGMNNPYVFTWSNDIPNSTWGFGSGCSTFYNTSLNSNTIMKRNFENNSYEIYASKYITENEELTHQYKSLKWRTCFKELNKLLEST